MIDQLVSQRESGKEIVKKFSWGWNKPQKQPLQHSLDLIGLTIEQFMLHSVVRKQ